MTQCEQILRHLRNEGSITQREAAQRYRIYDLRREGHDIKKTMEQGKDSQYARYYLEQMTMSL